MSISVSCNRNTVVFTLYFWTNFAQYLVPMDTSVQLSERVAALCRESVNHNIMASKLVAIEQNYKVGSEFAGSQPHCAVSQVTVLC